jgi:hypothetical protein
MMREANKSGDLAMVHHKIDIDEFLALFKKVSCPSQSTPLPQGARMATPCRVPVILS